MIWKNGLSRVLACLFLIFFSVVVAKARSTEPVILILNSYHQGFEWSDKEIAGELEVLHETYPSASIYVEHMDQKRFPDSLNNREFTNQIVNKFKDQKPDIIIANDNIATASALFLKEQSWPNIPLVFAGFSGRQFLPTPLPQGVTGVIEEFDMEKHITMLKRLSPELQNLFIIGEASNKGNRILQEIRPQLNREHELSIVYLQNESLDEIRSTVLDLPQNSAILLLPYSRLSSGKFVGNKIIGKIIAEASSAPVYVSYDSFMGTGVVGGHVFSAHEQGTIAAQMAIEILQTGFTPPSLTKAPTTPTFDLHALKEFHISLDHIPENSVLTNSSKSCFFGHYGKIIIYILIAVSLIVISLLSLSTYYKKKHAQNLQELFDSIEESLIIIDANDMSITRYNPASLRLLGYPLDESAKLTLQHFCVEEAPYNERYALQWFDKAKRSSSSQMISWKIRQQDGNFRWVEVGLQYTTLAGKKCFVMVIRDVDDRHNMSLQLQEYRDRLQQMVDRKTDDLQASQQKLERLKDKAVAANNAKSEFIATMSHEMRTPLTGVIGLMQVLKATPLNAEQHNFISRALTAGRQLLVTINDILDFAKMESGDVKITNNPFNLQQVLLSAQDSVFINPEQNLVLVEKIDENVPHHLIGDQFRLGQVLINLLGNAAKFTEQGQVTLEVSVMSDNEENTQLRFQVRDTGPGIPQEIQGRLFEAFFQVDSKKTHRGTGLGLNICHKLVTAMGGSIGVMDNEGGGSCFWFELTFTKGQEDVNISNERIATSSPVTSRQHIYAGKKILLVEDNEINMYMIKTLLFSGGGEVFLARNGQEGIDLLAEQEVDIVIMDVQMPVMDGHEATKLIRQNPKYKDLPIIAMTANIFSHDVDECLNAGMNGHLAKPFTVTELDEILLDALKV